MKKTAEFIEEAKEARRNERRKAKGQRKTADPEYREALRKRRLAKIAPYMFKAGESGNPGGRPKHDVAKEIAQAVMEGNKEAAYLAFTKALLKGNAYVFKELADRAYGKVKETIEHSGSLGIVEVKARVKDLLAKRDAD